MVDNIVSQAGEAVSSLNLDSLEFAPTPDETWKMIKSRYAIRQNYIVKFSDDNIDQSPALIDCLSTRGCTSRVSYKKVELLFSIYAFLHSCMCVCRFYMWILEAGFRVCIHMRIRAHI